MSYSINIERRARREIGKLSQPTLSRVVDVIDDLGSQPRPAGCKKLSGSRCEWRIRVGDYRIFYELDDRAMSVNVFAIGHRRDVYLQ